MSTAQKTAATDHDDEAVKLISDVIAEAGLLVDKARTLERFFKGPNCLVELMSAELDTSSASGALSIALRPKAMELNLVLLPALRAGNRELLIVEQHLAPLVRLATAIGANPAGSRNACAGGERVTA